MRNGEANDARCSRNWTGNRNEDIGMGFVCERQPCECFIGSRLIYFYSLKLYLDHLIIKVTVEFTFKANFRLSF